MSADYNNPTDAISEELLPDSARDLLISRVIDGRANTADWDRFRALAANEPAIWCELADTQRQHEAVRDELSTMFSIADSVELPGGTIDDTHTRQRLGHVSRWGGWAAAAALLFVWSFGRQTLPSDADLNTDSPVQTGSMIPGIGLSDAEPEEAFEQYLNAGQKSGVVIAEMPEQVVVDTTPLPDGTIEVLYLRQVIERRVIDQAYRQVRDDAGNIIAVPIRIDTSTSKAF